MARKRGTVKKGSPHTKSVDVILALSPQDHELATRAAKLFADERGIPFGRGSFGAGSILRELGMPAVREYLAKAEKAAA